MKARKVASIDPVLGPLSEDRLTSDFWVYQRLEGHRFSCDDVMTAFIGWQAAPQAEHVLDLGCGLGSVLLHLAWKLPQARLVGVEAQASSYELVLRNIARNSLQDRVRAHHADLRDGDLLRVLGRRFELITGTPPYFPVACALESSDEQRSFARIEFRGGVEAYVQSGASALASGGALVVCADARAAARVTDSAQSAGLHARLRCDVLPRSGRPALFSVWTLRHEAGELDASTMVLRDEDGERTEDAERLRAFSGFSQAAKPAADQRV